MTQYAHQKTLQPTCLEIVDAICSFDSARIEVFRAVKGNLDLMGVDRLDELSLLHNKQVGYFNRVYGFTDQSVDKLNAIEDFYGCLSRPYFLVVPHALTSAQSRQELITRGYTAYEDAVFLGNELLMPIVSPVSGLSFEPVDEQSIDEYIALYLKCFDARPENLPSARVNMRELLKISKHEFWLARADGRLKGLCAARETAQATFLCAGAVHESFRGTGIHQKLIRYRLATAQKNGVPLAVTWAIRNGQSHQNAMNAGFHHEFSVTVFASPKT